MRTDSHFGGRKMRCFAERATGIDGLLQRAAAAAPGQEALVCGTRCLSRAEVDAEASRAAGSLIARGVQVGDRVALLLGNDHGIHFAITLFAVARLRAISVPVSTRLRQPELRYVRGDCGATALVFDATLHDNVPNDTSLVGAYGGSPMPPDTIVALQARWPGLALMNAYGATETASPTTVKPAPHTAGRSASVGRTVPCAEVSIRAAMGRPGPAGDAGKVWIDGPMGVPGYWNNMDETARSFSTVGRRSGDIGSLDADGYLRVHDRLKDAVNWGGYKVDLAEVEGVIGSHDGVLEGAVVGGPCEVRGERLHALVSRRSPAPGAAVLLGYCHERIADCKAPVTWTPVDEPLPRNANGKLLKRLPRERLHAVAMT